MPTDTTVPSPISKWADRFPKSQRVKPNFDIFNGLLEPIGFGRSNYDALWVDPVEYTLQLAEAADELLQGNIPFSIYNHQLCTIPEKLWPFCVPSIFEWKNIYIEECVSCQVKSRCGGFFILLLRSIALL